VLFPWRFWRVVFAVTEQIESGFASLADYKVLDVAQVVSLNGRPWG